MVERALTARLTRKELLWRGGLIVGGLAAAGLLQACGETPTPTLSQPTPTGAAKAAASPTSAPAVKASPAATESVELTMWVGWSLSNDDVRGKYLNQTVDAYRKVAPNLKVTLVQQPFAKYPEIFRAAVVSNTGPDVAMVWPGQFLLDYEKAWLPIELTAAEQAEIVDLASVSRDFNPEKGPIYAIPWGLETNFFLYNKQLFQKAGLDPEKPPATWDELVAACEKLKASGITALAAGGKGGSIIGNYLPGAMAQVMDPGEGAKMNTGELSVKDPRFSAFFDSAAKLFTTYAQEGYRTMPYFPDSIDYMAAGKAAMVLGWFSRVVYVDKGLGTQNFGVFRYPNLSNAKHPETAAIAAGGAYTATKFSKYPEEAIATAKWFGNKQNQQRMMSDLGIIASRKDIDPGLLALPQLKTALDWVLKGKTVSTILVYRLPPEGSAELNKQFELVLLGEATSEQALDAVDKAVKSAKRS